uniref:Uncharacterized protein n=2 Tax=Oryza TaxID=4527 RepID=I1P196_ORYGL
MVGWMDNTLWQSVLLLQQQQPSSTSTTGATRKDDDDRRRRRRVRHQPTIDEVIPSLVRW